MHQYEIKEISLLTEEEYVENRDLIDKGNEPWWLKTPYHSEDRKDVVMIVSPVVREFMGEFTYFSLGVRPTLKVSNLESFGCEKGDKVDIFGLQWTVLSGDTVLCDEIIGKAPFTKMENYEIANDFETSDIKDFLNGWLRLENIREAYSTCYNDEIAEAMGAIFEPDLPEDRYCKMFRSLAKEYIERPDRRQGIDFSLNATVGRDLGEIAELAMAVAKERACEQSRDIESNKEESLNTKISYMYRDACNYKRPQSVVLSGELTKGQIQQIYDSCDGEFFIPAQVGLPEIRFGEITEDDSCWFEIGDITLTLDNPTENYTVKEVLDKFLDAKENGWDDVKYASEISDRD